jgi:hypothetical protein
MATRQNIHRKIYFGLLILLAVSIPLSEFIMSITQMLLALNWLIEGQFKKKLVNLKTNWTILFFPLLLLVHVIWLINTEDIAYALKDIRVKLPLLTLPIIIGSSEKLSFKQSKIILLLFVSSVLYASFVGLSILTGLYNYKYDEINDISIYISHIRYSLMIVFSIYILLYYTIFQYRSIKRYEIIIYVIVSIWLLIFLYLLQALTGIIIFAIISYVLLIYYALKIKNLFGRLFSIVFLITLLLISVSYITKSVARFYYVEPIDLGQLENKTACGGTYTHNLNEPLVENGHYVWIYIEENELRKDWNTKSSINYDSLDLKGQPLKYTLMRYLTALGHRKDSVGLSNLTQKDVQNVESGIANPVLLKPYHPYTIIYKIIWEIDHYKQTGNATGHTLTQRFEYLKAAKRIIKQNFWFGVGTGDLNNSFHAEYDKMNSELSEKSRRRAHNQFITFWVAFGFIGFIISVLLYFFPYLYSKNKNILFTVFFLITSLSMLNEDTLETQEGVTFVLFFYCIFVSTLILNKKQSNNERI